MLSNASEQSFPKIWKISGFIFRQCLFAFTWNAKRFVIACVFLLVILPALSGLSGNPEQKIILQTIEQLTQYTVSGIQFRYLKYTVVIRIRKNLINFPFPSKRYKTISV